MNVNEILDVMEDMLDKAWSLPLTGGKCVVDVERMAELLSDVRLNMPQEVKQAKMIVADRLQIINDAKKEAEDIIRVAQERVKRMVSEEEIVRQAQAQANEMLTQAHQQSRELKKATGDFVDSMLMKTEEVMAKNLAELKETRNVLHKGKQRQRPQE